MRDIVIFSALLWFSVRALKNPWIGILGWTWVSIMNPHQFAYGFVKSFPVAMMVGAATLVGLVITKDRKHFPVMPETTMLTLFMLWMCITLPFSMFYDESFEMWKRVMKIDLMILVAVSLLYTRKHVVLLVWVLAVSIGFYGFKGGLFTIATGGGYRVWGPENSFIAGNNEVALALVVVIPLIRFLYQHGGLSRLWMRRGMILWMLLCAIAALGSQSRGAMLALAAMSFMLWLKSRRKVLIGVGILIAALALVSFMPESWSDRMNTVGSYQKDASAMGRISAWKMAFNAAKDRVFGTGYQNVKPEVYLIYGDAELLASSTEHMEQGPHSIYFEVLGEQGFIGLFLFLGTWFFVWRSGSRMLIEAKKHPVELGWCGDLAASCHTSMVGYGVGGAFLGLAYWDLPYNLLVLMVATQVWIKRKGWEEEALSKPVAVVGALNQTVRKPG